jgi:ABC-2 type transport system ATP-binding protein
MDTGYLAVIETRGLMKRYSASTAVENVGFSIGAGEVLGLLGPNGSGKSTVVKMVTGLLEPTRGDVLFRGERIGALGAAYKRHLGYVPEQPDLYMFLTGWEYLEMVATLRAMPRPQFRRRASTLLEKFGIYSSRDVPIGSYSKGMRQRVVLIAALLDDPELLVLDEPFSGLDVTSAMVLRGVIEQLSKLGKAILFSSPVLEQMERLCTHLVVLKRGQVVAAGTMGEVQSAFSGLGLEAGFMQLTEQVDTESVAGEIVHAITTTPR